MRWSIIMKHFLYSSIHTFFEWVWWKMFWMLLKRELVLAQEIQFGSPDFLFHDRVGSGQKTRLGRQAIL